MIARLVYGSTRNGIKCTLDFDDTCISLRVSFCSSCAFRLKPYYFFDIFKHRKISWLIYRRKQFISYLCFRAEERERLEKDKLILCKRSIIFVIVRWFVRYLWDIRRDIIDLIVGTDLF